MTAHAKIWGSVSGKLSPSLFHRWQGGGLGRRSLESQAQVPVQPHLLLGPRSPHL